ncbi:hypothetical protein Amal_03418 [Acetobacter malorum]|uniref:Uncharacterized protein n=1 Tax=Acetobacter malorum TaxID=178901 RepID=A0A177G517_9PROT|nr:hypothetical protein Amal_03418 [Acetobacter malorum]
MEECLIRAKNQFANGRAHSVSTNHKIVVFRRFLTVFCSDVRRQDLWDEIGELNNGGFLAHRNDEGVKYEPEILAGDDIGGTVDPRYPPGDASAVFGGREDPHCA